MNRADKQRQKSNIYRPTELLKSSGSISFAGQSLSQYHTAHFTPVAEGLSRINTLQNHEQLILELLYTDSSEETIS